MKPVVAVTQGDPNGIGPEVALKAVAHPRVRRACTPLLVGHPGAFLYYARKYRYHQTFVLTRTLDQSHRSAADRALPVVIPHTPPSLTVRPGRVTGAAGRSALDAILCATGLALEGAVDAIVTAPVSKQALHRAGATYPGQTEMLRDLTGAPDVVMMLVCPGLRVALATIHVPLRKVAASLSVPMLVRKGRTVRRALITDWRIAHPRLAVLGLNPHAGEGGHIGREDGSIILAAVRRLRTAGLTVEGPFPADAFFARGEYRKYDAVLAMYHDQGLIPLKMLAAGRGVNVSAGLPIVRTSPDHGTAFDIAGRGVADEQSMVEAILLAVRCARSRRQGSPP